MECNLYLFIQGGIEKEILRSRKDLVGTHLHFSSIGYEEGVVGGPVGAG